MLHPKSPFREQQPDFLSPRMDPQYPQLLLPLKHQSFWTTKNRLPGVQLELRYLELQKLTFFYMAIILLFPFGRGQEMHINSYLFR